MSNPVLGHVTCPHCGNDAATVHRESRGRAKKLYYRCYSGGACGTIQCRGEGGQRWIASHVTWLAGEAQEQSAADAAHDAAEGAAEAIRGERRKAQRESAPAVRGGLSSLIWSSEDE